MADEKLLKWLIENGVDSWNAARKESHNRILEDPTLALSTDLDLSIQIADFKDANFLWALRDYGNLNDDWPISLACIDLVEANLTGAMLRKVDLSNAELAAADLEGTRLGEAILTDAQVQDADLTNADLEGANLTGADLTNLILTGADLYRAIVKDADLTTTDLVEADLTNINLWEATLIPFRYNITNSIQRSTKKDKVDRRSVDRNA